MAHSYRSLYLHIIFHVSKCTILPADVQPVHAFMRGVLADKGCTAITIGGTENHIHVLACFPVDEISKTIGVAKTATNHWLKKRNISEYADFSWQSGYGLFSVSYSRIGAVRQYIANQQEHHRKISAEEEFAKFLEAHGLEYHPEWK